MKSWKNNIILVFFAVLLIGCFIPGRLFSTRFLDESIALLLFCVLVATYLKKYNGWRKFATCTSFLAVIAVFTFYFIQSAFWGSNTFPAVLYDALVEFKPFVGFFSVLLLAPHFTQKQRKFLKYLCIIPIAFGLIAAFGGQIWLLLEHPARFAFLFTVCALIFIWLSEINVQNIIIFFAILAVGFLSTRSKFYGFFAFSLFIWLYYLCKKDIQFKKTDIWLFVIALAGVIIVALPKFNMYFLDEQFLSVEYMDSRKVLFSTAFQIANDHFPLGSGFGSFGTDASTRILSPIYEQYGILAENGELPICTCDSLSAALLAQFGYLGVCLFLLFWGYILRKTYRLAVRNNNKKLFIIGISIVAFFIIETFSDSTFTQNRGLLVMMLLAFVILDFRHKSQDTRY
ncbi:MAG: hypothetical protein LBN27_10695 [Prevotellaceae bacterium]|jgi:hypothetical protein|nr:hypothetical protein [Prevotellaceae bacterium]